MGGSALPVLAACYEGRPVKLLPSLQYPAGPGLPATAQASILDLYDPGRSKHILVNGKPASEDEFRGAFSSWSRNLRDGGHIGILQMCIRDRASVLRRPPQAVQAYAHPGGVQYLSLIHI